MNKGSVKQRALAIDAQIAQASQLSSSPTQKSPAIRRSATSWIKYPSASSNTSFASRRVPLVNRSARSLSVDTRTCLRSPHENFSQSIAEIEEQLRAMLDEFIAEWGAKIEALRRPTSPTIYAPEDVTHGQPIAPLQIENKVLLEQMASNSMPLAAPSPAQPQDHEEVLGASESPKATAQDTEEYPQPTNESQGIQPIASLSIKLAAIAVLENTRYNELHSSRVSNILRLHKRVLYVC